MIRIVDCFLLRVFRSSIYFPFFLILVSCSVQDNKSALVSYSSKNIIGYENKPVIVDSQFLPAMYRIDNYAQKNNVRLIVTNSFRTPDQKLTNTVVPPAKRSNHLAGHAIDMNVQYNGVLYDSKVLKKANLKNLPANVRNFINNIREDKGLRWGGDFSTEDPVHIDDGLNENSLAWEARFNATQYGKTPYN